MDRNSCLAALSLRPALLALLCTEGCYSQTSSSRPLGACREMRPQPARRKLLAATPTACHPRSRWPSTLNLQGPSSSLHVGTRRPLPAYCEVRSHLGHGEVGAATPTASHPPPWRASALNSRVPPPRRSTSSEAAGRFAHMMNCARLATGKLGAASRPQGIPGARGRHFNGMSVVRPSGRRPPVTSRLVVPNPTGLPERRFGITSGYPTIRSLPCRPPPSERTSRRQLWIVTNVPDCVDPPPEVAVMDWSPLLSDAGTTTLN
jgi:hypothetical protein